MTDKCSIQVALKIRPLVDNELEKDCQDVLKVYKEFEQVNIAGTDTSFTFNYVLSPSSTHEELYVKCISPLVDNLFSGYNVTILAYGQTGSGKTHSMGTNYDGHGEKGVIPRSVYHIFQKIAEDHVHNIQVCVSFVELYQEVLYDLLSGRTRDQSSLELREDNRGVFIQGVTEIPVQSGDDILRLLAKGSSKRATAATNMNAHSSRSHAIFTINLTLQKKNDCNNRKTAKFNLVDLAGSERAKKTGTIGLNFKEGTKINTGLLVLGNVISALGDNSSKGHIPYRDSNLTRLLKDSLGGNSITLMIACVSPADYNLNETLSTLRYADRARKIENKPIVNQDINNAEMIELKKINQKLKKKMVIQKAYQVCNCEAEIENKNKIVDVLFQLSTAVSDNVCLLQNNLDVQKNHKNIIDFKNEFERTKIKSGQSADAFVKENLEKLESIVQSIKKADEIYENVNSFNDALSVSTSNKIPESQILMNKTVLENYTSRQIMLRTELEYVLRTLRTKKRLLFYIKNDMPRSNSEHQILTLKTELSRLERRKRTQINMAPQMSEDLQRRITDIDGQIKEQMQRKLKQKADQEKIDKLEADIGELEKSQVNLIEQMHRLLLDFKKWKVLRENESSFFKNNDTVNIGNVRKRIEEAETLEKKIAKVSELLKQSQNPISKNQEQFQEWLRSEIDYYLHLIEAKTLLHILVEDKTSLQSQENDEKYGEDLIQIDMKIQNLQDIILHMEEFENEIKWDNIKYVEEGRSALKILWDVLGEIAENKFVFERMTKKQKSEHEEMTQILKTKEQSIKDLEEKHSKDLDDCGKEYLKNIDVYLRLLKRTPLEDDLHELIRKNAKLELENKKLKNENLRLQQTSNGVIIVDNEKSPQQILDRRVLEENKQDNLCVQKLPSKRTINGGCMCTTTCNSNCCCIKTTKGCNSNCNCSSTECSNARKNMENDENSEMQQDTSNNTSERLNIFPTPQCLKSYLNESETSSSSASSLVPRKRNKRTKPFFERLEQN